MSDGATIGPGASVDKACCARISQGRFVQDFALLHDAAVAVVGILAQADV